MATDNTQPAVTQISLIQSILETARQQELELAILARSRPSVPGHVLDPAILEQTQVPNLEASEQLPQLEWDGTVEIDGGGRGL